MKKYQDFGNKIGGAKKDIWAAGMQVSHIDGMSEKEMKKFVNKNAVFPKPDYENMDQEPLVIYWKKLVRDTIPPSPKKWDEGGVKDYVSVVQHIACIVNSVDAIEDIEALKDGLEEMANLRKEIINAFPISTSREETVRRNLYYLIKYPNLKKIDEDRVKKGFMCTLEEKMRATYAFDKLLISKEDRPIATKGGQYRYILKTGTVRLSFWRNEILKPETYCIFVSVGSEIDILGYNIASEKEADETINAFIAAKVLAAEAQSKGTSNRKKRLVPEYLDEIKREGKDVIGAHVIDGTTYLKEFKLYGGEYGNCATCSTTSL